MVEGIFSIVYLVIAGFNVRAYVDHEFGFICGGNEWNCGTWMDKMGNSHKAGNARVPATPRDGAAVELQGLAYAVICSLQHLHKKGLFPESGVTNGKVFCELSFKKYVNLSFNVKS